jgi:hypothetical protein
VTSVAQPPVTGTRDAAEHLAAAAFDLARRFAAGATLWCASPGWPSHAHHLAVEFIHPVIVGKRALPAVAVDGDDPAGVLRLLTRPGDGLVVVADEGDPRAADLLLRAEAWGLGTFVLGGHGRTPGCRADHVILPESTDPVRAVRDGGVVVLYHLLWELTHVVLEHPGLVEPAAARADDHCVTCSDEGKVGEIRTVEGWRAEASVAGVVEQVDVRLLGQVTAGDLVLVHAGVALAPLGGVRS